jgi:HSP20 family molecular chaperone IbpA
LIAIGALRSGSDSRRRESTPRQAVTRMSISLCVSSGTSFARRLRGLENMEDIFRALTEAIGSRKGVHAVYGLSIRVGLQGLPVVARFGNVRHDAGKAPVVDETREPIADVFDEEDHYLVVAELPGVDQPAVQWSVRDGRFVVIGAESAGRKYYKEIELSGPVDDRTAVCRYANGVLELRLWKQ